MAAHKGKAGEMSGFDVVRAVQNARAGQGSTPASKPPRAPPATAPPPSGPKPAPAARIGKTAVPTKHEFVCYECGYTFTVAGKAHTLYCAKCRTVLNQTDYRIDKPHDVSIVTAGSITITEDGVWEGGIASARDIILAGRQTGGILKAFRRLELTARAVFLADGVDARDLIIRADAVITPDAPLTFRNVDIHGELEADLTATGLVTIHPGGHLKGRLQAAHVKVVEGGGLTAQVRIEPG